MTLRWHRMSRERRRGRVYVVFGETGEYSYFRFWTVAAHQTKRRAEAHAKRLNDWCEENLADDKYGTKVKSCPLDPQFEYDYTGTEYRVEEVPLGSIPA